MVKLKDMFRKTADISTGEGRKKVEKKPEVPRGMWTKCPVCGELLYREDVIENHYVCPKCSGCFRITAKTRIRMIADPGTFTAWGEEICGKNPLAYPEYEEKLEELQERTGLSEAVIIGSCRIQGEKAVLGVCDSRFLMGSMGYAVGERITAAFERACQERLPVVLFCCSGGARMQEGIVSLMQMAKTAAAIGKHSEAGLFYLPILTDPTMGGVTASFAMLGDIILAEPGALIGFAGPRVIAQTIGQKLPDGFQRAEFLAEKGFLDGILERGRMKETIARLLLAHKTEKNYQNLIIRGRKEERSREEEAKREKKRESGDAWERVLLSRKKDRPGSGDYIRGIFDDFIELRGDRTFRDDGAVLGGIGWLEDYPVTVIGQQKGKNVKENVACNFGMASPEGYRKALRLMKQAEKFHRPVILFVDTPGAACGIEAEERGQGEAIARNLMEMMNLKTPLLSILIGEGGSGGALGLAVADEVWMMENATYSILSPEGFASILWKDGKKAREAAELMKITAPDLKEMGIVDCILSEEEPVTRKNLYRVTGEIREKIEDFLKREKEYDPDQLTKRRYQRFRKY